MIRKAIVGMLNMSDQFYNYLSSKLFDYFKSNPLVNGDRFYIQFDEDSQIVDFYNSIECSPKLIFDFSSNNFLA